MTHPPWGDIVFAGDYQSDPAVLTRAVQRGTLHRLTRGVYTSVVDASPEKVTSRYLWHIVARLFPGAAIADRSVFDGGLAREGQLFIVHTRRRPVRLPGVTVFPRTGPGPVTGDMPLPDGLWISSTERALLDNLASDPKSEQNRTLTRGELEAWLETLLQQRGEKGVNSLRSKARAIAGPLNRQQEMRILDEIIAAALTTGDSSNLVSPQLKARAATMPYDIRRIDSFRALVAELNKTSPEIVPALPVDDPRRALLPFYEAYFSNFIEGIEFSLDQAAEIIFQHELPTDRPQDVHDILGTYEIVNDDTEMARTPNDANDFIELMKARHAILMSSRPYKNPGLFKEKANRAGGTEFVAPNLVIGTLREGFAIGESLVSPFHRAVYMMFLVSEIHPFTDGNGRIARIMMNAELVAGGEVRIIVPTVYRANYLAALKGATHTQHYQGLISVLSFARRYTARVNFTNRQTAEQDLDHTFALRDSLEAEQAGIRLILPLGQ